MSRIPDGFAFFRGFVVGALGVVLLFVGILLGIQVDGEAITPWWIWRGLFYLGASALFIGPAWYWIGRPVYVWYRGNGGDDR